MAVTVKNALRNALLLLAACALIFGLSGCAQHETAKISEEETPLGIADSITTWDTAGDFQISGGTQGTATDKKDYYIESNILHICSSTPLVIKSSKTTAQTIDIDAGVKADITLAGLDISTTVRSPINMITNVYDTEANKTATTKVKATHADQILNKTTLYLTIADNTTNKLMFTKTDATANTGWPGLRCGWGSILVIDDEITNIKKGGSKFNLADIVTPENGMIGADVELLGGKALKKGDPIGNMESSNAGSLTVQGGYHSAGIGSGPSENAGTLIINGGDVTSKIAGSSTPFNGSAIGGSSNGSGTIITINGGRVSATGTGCGTAIGSAFGYYTTSHNGSTFKSDAIEVSTSVNTFEKSQGYSWYGSTVGTPYTYSANNVDDFAAHTIQATTSPHYYTVAGDITINGGYVYAKSGIHGNAIGQSCGHGPNTNRGHIIRITGGTVVAESQSINNSNPYMFGIGARLGYTIVTGGSVQVQKATSGSYKDKVLFQGLGGTAYNTLGIETWDDVLEKAGGDPVSATGYTGKKLPDGDKVQMLEINLSEDVKVNGTVPDRVTITSWELKIDNIPYDYGAPTYLDKGKAYVWVPASATGKNVTVTMSYLNAAGEKKDIEPLYVEEVGSATGSTLKRYIDIDVEKLPAEKKTFFNSMKKKYDGLPLTSFDIANNPIDTTPFEAEGKTLDKTETVTTNFQLYDKKEGNPTGDVHTGNTMPADSGTFRVQFISKQYATGSFGNSYWGHRITGWAEIEPVPAVLTLDKAEWGNLDLTTGTWTPTTTASDKAGNRIKVTFNVRSAKGTALTCKTPTGAVQLKIDGKNLGKPITLTKEGIEASKWSTYTETPGATVATANTEAAMAGTENRWVANVVYYFDPTQGDGLLEEKKSFSLSSVNTQTDMLLASISLLADEAAPATSADNTYTLTAEYLPDKNYVEGLEANPQNADEGETIIIPVDAGAKVVDEEGTTIDFKPAPSTPDGSGTGGNTSGGGSSGGSTSKGKTSYAHMTKYFSELKTSVVGEETVTGADDEEVKKDILARFLKLSVDSDSAMEMEWSTDNEGVATIAEDEDGNPILKVDSCGSVAITIRQPGNAIYNEQTWVIMLDILPDPTIKPDTEVRVVMNNLTNPGAAPAPGDEIEYIVVGSNLTDGSAWQDVVLGDVLSEYVALDPTSVEIAKNFASPADLSKLSADDLKDVVFTKASATTSKDSDGNDTLSLAVGTIYGGQSTAIRFSAKVSSDIPLDRETIEGGKAPVLVNKPTVTGGYGKKEIPDPETGEKTVEPGSSATPITDTQIYGIDDDDDSARLIPREPTLGGGSTGDEGGDDGDGSGGGNNSTDKADVLLTKTASNLTRDDGTTLAGDRVSYTITIKNTSTNACLYSPVIYDKVPTGLSPDTSTFKLTLPNGTTKEVSADVLDQTSNTIALYTDALYAGESSSLSFECSVGNNASTAANLATTFGETPANKNRKENPTDGKLAENTDTTPGDPWSPEKGTSTKDFDWEDFDIDEFLEKNGNPGVQTERPATPGTFVFPDGTREEEPWEGPAGFKPEVFEDNEGTGEQGIETELGELTPEEDENTNTEDGTEGNTNTGDNDNNNTAGVGGEGNPATGMSDNALSRVLAATGDPVMLAGIGIGVVALIAGAILVISRRKQQN